MDFENMSLGIEFGSTRIKAVLIDEQYTVQAKGEFAWENNYQNNYYTYDLKDVIVGLQTAYKQLNESVFEKFGAYIEKIGALGISGMMHGYIALDKEDNLLVPFRTWRNTRQKESAEKLSKLFSFHIPERWTIAHLYQAMLNKEPHVKDIAYLTTLAGYVHYVLTGEKCVGIGEASGMFPVCNEKVAYDAHMVAQFDDILKEANMPFGVQEILPKVQKAGEKAGQLSKSGALLIDPTGHLQSGVFLCPPEGDAGTGMVATNSVRQRTGNVSAGTSIFSMAVLEKPLENMYEEVDIVATPCASAVAMVHCNNCTGDINAWMKMFREYNALLGLEIEDNALYQKLFTHALKGEKDCGQMIAYNYTSGEHMTGVTQGRPLFVRSHESNLTLANFMRTHLYSTMATLKLGMDLLKEKENVCLDCINAHGGLFKTEGVAQSFLAGALNTAVNVYQTASEGGAYGIALLAHYMKNSALSLADFLDNVFKDETVCVLSPQKEDVQGFDTFIQNYQQGLTVERMAQQVF